VLILCSFYAIYLYRSLLLAHTFNRMIETNGG
jgi:hypothetical protein